jgi:hypothetical protein
VRRVAAQSAQEVNVCMFLHRLSATVPTISGWIEQ